MISEASVDSRDLHLYALPDLVEVRWLVKPRGLPKVVRRCASCGGPRPFVTTGRFRLNAQGRRIDVWLLYRCEACGAKYGATVYRRCRPDEIKDLEARTAESSLKIAKSQKQCAFIEEIIDA